MAESACTLVVMIKAPVAGAVKTRLARQIGTIEALRFYRTATARLIRRVAGDPRWTTILAVTPDGQVGARFWPSTLARTKQGPGDLGNRMHRLLERSLPRPVVIVGSDIPDLRAGHIAQAFRLLGRHDLVFGPAEDGGYWLVGARGRSRMPNLFSGVRWSTEHALTDTIRNARCSVGLLETLADVDTEADWRRWREGPDHEPEQRHRPVGDRQPAMRAPMLVGSKLKR
jgi:rSAM/selenodomain-associated transferase 1